MLLAAGQGRCFRVAKAWLHLRSFDSYKTFAFVIYFSSAYFYLLTNLTTVKYSVKSRRALGKLWFHTILDFLWVLLRYGSCCMVRLTSSVITLVSPLSSHCDRWLQLPPGVQFSFRPKSINIGTGKRLWKRSEFQSVEVRSQEITGLR